MIAVFDIGTSAIKCVILDNTQSVIYTAKKEITTLYKEHFVEQNPDEWYEIFCSILDEFNIKTQNIEHIHSIIFSGHMQDLICVDNNGNSVRDVIMYNDQRGAAYSHIIPHIIALKTTVGMNGTIPLAKLLWLKEHEELHYKNTYKVLNSAKDYIISKLTGKYISDVTSLSTSGMLDIKKKQYVEEISSLGIDVSILPDIYYADEVVGTVTPTASEQTLLSQNVKVYAGCGDAGATTLASGIINSGELNINLGTSGWIATISDTTRDGVFNLAAIHRDRYINVIPILNAASVHKWISHLLFEHDVHRYDTLHSLLSSDADIKTSLLCLPYLVGERFPVADNSIRGSFIGLDGKTTQRDLALSALEGVAFSLRQGLEKLNVIPKKYLSLEEGQKKTSGIKYLPTSLKTTITVFPDSEYLPSIALASCVLLNEGTILSYQEYINALLIKYECTTFTPQEEMNEYYQEKYEKFKQIYPSTIALFK